MQNKTSCVYIMASRRNGTLYVGVTSNLPARVHQHKNSAADGFTKQHHVHTLVYYEAAETMYAAIAREKQIKGGSRKSKIMLIEKVNPAWRDLSGDL